MRADFVAAPEIRRTRSLVPYPFLHFLGSRVNDCLRAPDVDVSVTRESAEIETTYLSTGIRRSGLEIRGKATLNLLREFADSIDRINVELSTA